MGALGAGHNIGTIEIVELKKKSGGIAERSFC